MYGCLEIVGHGYVTGACSVVPRNGKSTEEGCVKFLEGLDEVVGVLLADLLDPKVFDTKREIDGLVGVLPERRSSGNMGESKMGKVIFEPVVGNAASLFEAGHAFSDLKVNPAFRTECAEVVLVDDFVRDTGQRKFHVLVAGDGGTKVKILDI